MRSMSYDVDRLRFRDLLQPDTLAGMTVGGVAALAIFDQFLALPVMGFLMAYGYFQTMALRKDRLFLARHFGLNYRMEEIERLRLSILDHLRMMGTSGVAVSLEAFPSHLDDLARRGFHFAIALKKLQETRTLTELDGEVALIERKIQAAKDSEERVHLELARAHLNRERTAIVRAEILQKRVEAQLVALYQFFKTAETEMRSVSARVLTATQPQAPMLVQETRELLTAVREVEEVLRELEDGPHAAQIYLEAQPSDPTRLSR